MLITTQVKGAASDTKILSYSWYKITADDEEKTVTQIVVIGEIENVGTSNIIYTYVIGTAFIDEAKIAAASQEARGGNIQPGQKVPFYLVFTAQSITDEEITELTGVTDIEVSTGYVATNNNKIDIDATVSSKKDQGAAPHTITGTVTYNTKDKEVVRSIRVVVTYYNSKGTVVSLGHTGLIGVPSNSGQSAEIPFTVSPMDDHFRGDIASYEIFVQYNTEQASNTTPSTSTTPSSTPTTPASTPTTPPTTTKPKLDNTWIIITGLIIALIAISIILLLTRKKPNKTNTTYT
jgi:hypothetical protein